MRRLQVTNAEEMQLALKDEVKKSEEARYNHRCHAVLLVISGQSCYQVATLLGHSPRTIQRWVNQFKDGGFDGLRDHFNGGRPARLTEEEQRQIARDLRKPPRTFGYAQNLWDGKLLSYHIQKTFGKVLKVRQCQYLFHKLGFRQRKPRAVSAKADPVAQNVCKKNSDAWLNEEM